MRIRSIKPEFWRSEDVVALDWDTRLLFIGLWSYVDDNGVGRDDERLILADLFPMDEDLSEASVRIHGGLKRLFQQGLIDRYSLHGRKYLHITTWERHQKINRPSPGRFPLPEAIHDVLTEDSLSPHDVLTEDSLRARKEQGNRGAGEQGAGDSATRGDKIARTEDSLNPHHNPAQTLVGEWLDHCQQRPPTRVVAHLAKEIKNLLDEGQPYDDVRHAVATWQRKGIHPSALASVLHETRTAPAGTTKTQRNLAIIDAAVHRWESDPT